MSDLLGEVSDEYLEREWKRLYELQRQASNSLGEVKAEVMRRTLNSYAKRILK